MTSSMMPGTVLGGRYRLEDLLDDVDGARFWRATDTVLARSVAVHAIDESDPRVEGMLEAARISATITDPHLLRVLDADVRDGKAWVINEWGTGQSLDEMVSRGVLPPDRAAWLVREAASAVAVAHSTDLAHGRLAPENVMVTESGTVRLIGFAVDAALQRGRLRSGNYPDVDDKQADVLDLAGLLYAGLVGYWPGASGSLVKAAPRDGHGPLRPRQVRAGVPRPLDAICDRILARSTPDRTALQLAAVLTEYIGELAVAEPGLLPAPVSSPLPATPVPDPDASITATATRLPAGDPTPDPATDPATDPAPDPATDPTGDPTATTGDPEPVPAPPVTEPEPTSVVVVDALAPDDEPWDERRGDPATPADEPEDQQPDPPADPDGASESDAQAHADDDADAAFDSVSDTDLDDTYAGLALLGFDRPENDGDDGRDGDDGDDGRDTDEHASAPPAGPSDERGPDDPDATQRVVPVFVDETEARPAWTSLEDDTDWHQPRPEQAPPAPSLEPLPERPLFAPEGSRRTPKGTVPRSETSDWGTGEGALTSTGTGSLPAQPEPEWPFGRDPEEEPDDWEERTSRHWLRVPLVLAVLVVVAIVVAFVFTIDGKDNTGPGTGAGASPSTGTTPTSGQPIKVAAVKDLDPFGDPPEENPGEAKNAIDGNPSTTWQTMTYRGRPNLGGLKPGVGLMLDLGSIQNVGSVAVNLVGTPTNLVLYAAPTSAGVPTGIEGLDKVAGKDRAGQQVVLTPTTPVRARYLVVWLTSLPAVDGGFRGEVSDIAVRS